MNRQQYITMAMSETENAYMRESYGDAAWRKCVEFLYREGIDWFAAVDILMSKHMRWADDTEGRGDGRRTNSAAFKRYYANSKPLIVR